MGPRVVTLEGDVLEAEVEDALHVGIEHEARQGARRARELQAGLLEVVEIEMRVARGVDKLARLQPAHLRHHLQQQGIARNVERHAEKRVGGALVELQREAAVGHVKLEEQMAGRQVHAPEVGHVPCAHQQAARVGRFLDLADHLRNLVDVAAVVVGPGAPLIAVDMPEVAILVGPFVPDAHPVVLQILHVSVAAQKPQEFVDDAFQMQFLRGEQGEAVGEVEAHLMSEDAARARPRAVAFQRALFEYAAQQVLILFHGMFESIYV